MPRPKKPPGEKFRSPQIVVRLPGDLKQRLEAAATKHGKTVTEFVIPALERLAKK